MLESAYTDMNYISKCWQEFTFLTPEEENILKNITGINNCTKQNGGRKRKVIDHLTNKTYDSLKKCADDIGISPTRLCNCLREGLKTRKGHYFSYIEE